MDKETRKNAYLYCKFRDQQYDLYDKYAKEHGLLMKTFLVLNALYYARAGMTQKEISERTFNSKQTVSLIIKNLQKDQYVDTEPDPEDHRNMIIQMNEKGKKYCGELVRHVTWAEDTAMGMLSKEEQDQLVSLSRIFTLNLIKLIQSEDEDPAM